MTRFNTEHRLVGLRSDFNQEEKFVITLHSQSKCDTRYLMKNI